MSDEVVRALLRAVLPAASRSVVLADLEREAEIRRSLGHLEPAWLLRHGLMIGIRLRLSALANIRPRSIAGFGVELRQIVRGLARSPGLTIASVVVLALGVAAPTAVYSLVRAITRDLPLPHPEQLMTVRYSSGDVRGGAPLGLSSEQLRVVRGNNGQFGPVSAYRQVVWDLSSDELAPERVTGAWVTYDLLRTLGVQPAEGRDFLRADQGNAVAMIGHRLWAERFQSSVGAIGSSIRLGGVPHEIVGVLPDNVRLPDGAQVWALADLAMLADGPGPAPSDEPRMTTLVRLPTGSSEERLLAQITSAAGARTPESMGVASARRGHATFVVTPLRERLGVADEETATFLIGLLLLVCCLLLVATSNIANLFICRALARQSDVAVRAALGAGKTRIVIQHLAEAAVVAIVGGSLGVVLAIRAGAYMRAAGAGELEWWMDLRVDTGMLVFALGLTTLAALVAGLVPALQATGKSSRFRGNAPGGGGFRMGRASQILVVAEVMFAIALLVPVVMFARHVLGWQRDGDLDGREVLLAGYSIASTEARDAVSELHFHKELLSAIAARPGVKAAAIMTPFPGQLDTEQISVEAVGSDGGIEYTRLVRVSPGAFDLLGASIVRGRDVTWDDGDTSPASVIVNEAFASRFFGSQDPIGRQVVLTHATNGGFLRMEESVTATIVGIAPPVATVTGPNRLGDVLYLPLTVSVPENVYLMMRGPGDGDPLSMLPSLQAEIGKRDPERALTPVATLRAAMRSEARLGYTIFGMVGGIGLAGFLMSLTGLYAIVAFTVTRRTREVGVRIALGASARRVVWTMLRDAAVQLAQGVFLGLALTVLMAPVFRALTGTEDRSYSVQAAVAGILMLSGLFAAMLPGLGAIKIQPTVALRAE
jgi:putative ABC transport system permease protein